MISVNDELIDRFLDGDASSDEAAEVIAWLELPENIERYARRAELHADLRRSLRRRSIQSSAVTACEDGRSVMPSRQMLAIGAIALVTAACLLIALMLPRNGRDLNTSLPVLATVVSEIDAVLTKSDSNWQEPELTAGEYQLQQGLLHLQFDGGVMVYVEAPARFDAVSGKRLVLHSGRLSANVPPEGIGFTVETPEAEVVDFGTEFSVEVQNATSEVHVFNGLVRVQPRTGENETAMAVDLRTSQAVRIDKFSPEPVGISLATDRFIRNFDEPKRNYARTVKQLSPVAFYRMGIRDKGLAAEPPQHTGIVLTGDGVRPPHASGVFKGGSMRVRANSTGRGGRVDAPPQLDTGNFSLVVFVYLEQAAPGAAVATNILGDDGSFRLSLDESGRMRATVRNRDGELQSVVSDEVMQLATWRHVVMTADGETLRISENGNLSVSTPCEMIAGSESETIWFGTMSEGRGLWNGRIDELAMFDKALSDQDVADLYQAAVEEMARTK